MGVLGILSMVSMAVTAANPGRLPFQAGTWELSGSALLSAGNGTTLSVNGAPGYFLAPAHQVGADVGLGLGPSFDTVSFGPFYRFHIAVGSPWFVPYAGGQLGILYEHVDGFRDASDTWAFGQIMAGGKLMSGGNRWSALVELALRHYLDRDTDPFLNLGFGLSVYL